MKKHRDSGVYDKEVCGIVRKIIRFGQVLLTFSLAFPISLLSGVGLTFGKNIAGVLTSLIYVVEAGLVCKPVETGS